jgi:chromosome segregation ATPase
VTYSQIERAATDILKGGTRPTVASIRAALGGGSALTLMNGLNRYWQDLGNQVAGTPDTLRRLPAAVADLAEGVWERALTMATEAAAAKDAKRAPALSQQGRQLEMRAHTLSLREIELDGLLRSREQTARELEESLKIALAMLARRDASITSLEKRLAAAVQQTEGYRERLAQLIRSAVERHRVAHSPRRRAAAVGRSRTPSRKRKRHPTTPASRRKR